MAATYRVGIVGLGRVANTIQAEVLSYAGRMLLPYSHTHAYAAVPQTRVCAVADIDSQKKRRIHRAMAVRIRRDCRLFLL